VPAATRVPAAVVGAHAGALTVVALGVPAGRCTLLQFLVELDDVDLAVALQRLVDEPIEPGSRRLPPLPGRIPRWLIPAVTPYPLPVVLSIGHADKQRLARPLVEDDRHPGLRPYPLEPDIQFGHDDPATPSVSFRV
jgi:hypothetical protein